MSKAISREHLILMQGCEYVRSGIRRILPTLPPQQARELGHMATVLTHSLKARRRVPTPDGAGDRKKSALPRYGTAARCAPGSPDPIAKFRNDSGPPHSQRSPKES